MHWDAELGGPASSVADLAEARGAAREPREPGGSGRRVEASVSLDLTEPATARPSPASSTSAAARAAADWDDRVRALAARLDAAGEVDVRVLASASSERDVGAEAALGLGRAGYERTTEVRELVRAWSLPPGGTLQEREDCRPA